MADGNKNIKARASVRVVVFLVLCGILLVGISSLLTQGYSHDKYQNWQQQTETDILILGNSHAMDAIKSDLVESALKTEYGVDISVVNAAVPGQMIEHTFYYCRELLEHHKPKLVILDTFGLISTPEDSKESFFRWTFDELPLNQNKIEAIQDLIPDNEALSYYFPIIKHHARWKELLKKPSTEPTEELRYDDFFDHDVSQIIAEQEVESEKEEYLRNLIALLQDKEIPLLLVSVPYAKQLSMSGVDQIEINNYINSRQILDYDVFDMNKRRAELDFGYEDLKNLGHVNDIGAEKVSGYLSTYIGETAEILGLFEEDHTGYSQ